MICLLLTNFMRWQEKSTLLTERKYPSVKSTPWVRYCGRTHTCTMLTTTSATAELMPLNALKEIPVNR